MRPATASLRLRAAGGSGARRRARAPRRAASAAPRDRAAPAEGRHAADEAPPGWLEAYGALALCSEALNLAALITLSPAGCAVAFVAATGEEATSYALPGVAHILWAGVAAAGGARNALGALEGVASLLNKLLLVASAVRLARGDGLLSARAASPLSPLRLAEVGAYGTLLLQAAFVARWAALGCVGVDVTKPF